MSKVNVRKRGDLWEYRFELAKIDGKRKQFSKSGYRTKKEALEAGTKALAEYNLGGSVIDPQDMSVTDYLTYYSEQYISRLKPTTKHNYQNIIDKHILPVLGLYKLKALTPARMQEWINQLVDEGLSRGTIIQYKQVMNNALNQAVHPYQFIRSNPLQYVKIPKNVKVKGQSRIVSDDVFSILMQVYPMGTYLHIPLILGWSCGLRISEIFGLTWDRVDFDHNTILIDRQLHYNGGKEVNVNYPFRGTLMTPKTHSSVRTIKLGQELKKVLQNEYMRQEENRKFYGQYYRVLVMNEEGVVTAHDSSENLANTIPFVCVYDNGENIVPHTAQTATRATCKKYGIEFNWHGLRSANATNLLDGGVDIKTVQNRLGHTNINTTSQTYIHMTTFAESKGASVADDLLSTNDKTVGKMWTKEGKKQTS